ncbi:dienelactone hydrolase family protein [Halalkalibaculum sp. DA3122]|uniref:dienelactone hydrolase family protein n=1 Tax=unclassified Halalkalibaculum TaxID=2964617 RepID=UPI0037542274
MKSTGIISVIMIMTGILLVIGCSEEDKDLIDRMQLEHNDDEPVANAAADYSPIQEVTTETVTYATVDGEPVTGYLAYPGNAADDIPGIIVIHEWWGLNDNIRMMTRRLAEQGYRALAVDLYNGESAESADRAGELARKAGEHPERAVSNLEQAYRYLREEHRVPRVGTIGWCFGGGWSLQTALALPQNIDATVIYYGRLVTDPGQLQKLEMPILGIFGSEDSGIPPEEVRKFETALNEAGISNSIHIYDGAGHAFANPSGNRYMEEAAEDAWNKTISFFEEYLK